MPLAHHQYLRARDRINTVLDNAYERLSETDDYKRNQRNLRGIQLVVITASAIATGVVNSFAHLERLTWWGAIPLAFGITWFVERFYFVLRHGLTTCYKAGKQRFYAILCYRAIQITMGLNMALFTAYAVGFAIPDWLMIWNHWSIAAHFTLALFGVAAVFDSDAVVENRMLELKAETARQDLVTARKAAAIGNPIVLCSAKVRGFLDACGLAYHLLRRGNNFGKDYADQIDQVAQTQFGHINQIPGAQPRQFPRPVSRFPNLPPGNP